MSAPRLEYRRRKLILRGGGQPTAGQNEWQVAVPSRSVALQLGLYMLCLFASPVSVSKSASCRAWFSDRRASVRSAPIPL